MILKMKISVRQGRPILKDIISIKHVQIIWFYLPFVLSYKSFNSLKLEKYPFHVSLFLSFPLGSGTVSLSSSNLPSIFIPQLNESLIREPLSLSTLQFLTYSHASSVKWAIMTNCLNPRDVFKIWYRLGAGTERWFHVNRQKFKASF